MSKQFEEQTAFTDSMEYSQPATEPKLDSTTRKPYFVVTLVTLGLFVLLLVVVVLTLKPQPSQQAPVEKLVSPTPLAQESQTTKMLNELQARVDTANPDHMEQPVPVVDMEIEF